MTTQRASRAQHDIIRPSASGSGSSGRGGRSPREPSDFVRARLCRTSRSAPLLGVRSRAFDFCTLGARTRTRTRTRVRFTTIGTGGAQRRAAAGAYASRSYTADRVRARDLFVRKYAQKWQVLAGLDESQNVAERSARARAIIVVYTRRTPTRLWTFAITIDHMAHTHTHT